MDRKMHPVYDMDVKPPRPGRRNRPSAACLRPGGQPDANAFALLLLLAGLATPTPVLGLPTLRVQGGVRLDARATYTNDRATISGSLRDELGRGLAAHTLQVVYSTPARRLPVTTGPDGEFVAHVEVSPGAAVAVEYAGTAFYPSTDQRLVVTYPRRPVTLRFSDLPDTVDLDETRELSFWVHADSVAGAAALPIELSLNGRSAQTWTTDRTGRVRCTLREDQLRPDQTEVVARFKGDDRRHSATAFARVTGRAQPGLDLSMKRLPGRRRITATARLVARRVPLARQAVGLFGFPPRARPAPPQPREPSQGTRGGPAESHVATAMTDAAGVATFEFSDDALPDGTKQLQAVFVSHGPGLGDAMSTPVPVPAPPRSPRAAWLALPALLVLAVIGFASRRFRRPGAEPASHRGSSGSPPVFERGSSRGLPRTSLSVSGRVVDRTTGHSVAASVLLGDGHDRPAGQVETGDDGRFGLSAPAAGRYTLTVSAAGYRSERTEILLPHRGRWHGTTVHLPHLRTLTWQAAKRLTSAMTPPSEASPTLREALQRLPERSLQTGEASGGGLAELAAELERLLYRASPPTETAVAEVSAKVEHLLGALQVSHGAQEVGRRAATAHMVVDGKAGPSL